MCDLFITQCTRRSIHLLILFTGYVRVQVLSFGKSSVSYAIQFEKDTTVSSTSVTQITTSTENLIRTGGLTSTSDFEFDSSQKIETADSMCIIQYFILIMHTYHMCTGRGEHSVYIEQIRGMQNIHLTISRHTVFQAQVGITLRHISTIPGLLFSLHLLPTHIELRTIHMSFWLKQAHVYVLSLCYLYL